MTMAGEELERRAGSDRRARADAALAGRVLAALQRDEIEVLFQPQFGAADNALMGAEALSRWRHPSEGQIGANRLFALAERAHRVCEVTQHIARTALRAATGWPGELNLSLNVTATDLAARDFAETIAALLEQAGFGPERLTLEITEQSLVGDLDGSARALRALANKGIRVALDDFGAGFCNFRYLKRLPLHALKLDRSMVEGLGEDARDRAVLRGIVEMARALGLEVIAEGIESEAQREAIVREGCTAWQGFLGAEPMSAAEFAALVTPPPSPASPLS